MNEQDVPRYLSNRQDELDSAALYRAVADAESNPQLATVYRKLAAAEEQHAAFWAGTLREAGHTVPPGQRNPRLESPAAVGEYN